MTLPLAIVRSRPRHGSSRIIDAVRRWWRLLARPRTLPPARVQEAGRWWRLSIEELLAIGRAHAEAEQRLRVTEIAGGTPHAGAIEAGTTRRRPPPALPSPSDGTPGPR